MKLITFTLLASALPLALVAGEQKTIGRPPMQGCASIFPGMGGR